MTAKATLTRAEMRADIDRILDRLDTEIPEAQKRMDELLAQLLSRTSAPKHRLDPWEAGGKGRLTRDLETLIGDARARSLSDEEILAKVLDAAEGLREGLT